MSAQASKAVPNQGEELAEVLEALNTTAALSLEDSISMPPEAFTSEALLRLEREQIFSKEWICVGREGELQAPGDYFVTEPYSGWNGSRYSVKSGFVSAARVNCKHRVITLLPK